MANSLRHRVFGASRRFGNYADGQAAPSRNGAEIAAKPAEAGQLAVGGAVIDLAKSSVRAPDGTETELRLQSAVVLRVLAARRARR